MNGDEAVEEVTTDEDVAPTLMFGDAETRGDNTALDVALAVGVTEGLFKLMVVALELWVTEGLFKLTVVAEA